MSGNGSVYNVGVHLAAVDGVSGVIAALSKSVLKLHGEIGELNKAFRGLHPAILGATAAVGGMKIAHFAGDMIKANGELQRQVNLFKAAGNSADDAAAAINAAYKAAASVPQFNVTETMKTYREVAGATQDNIGARKILADVMKAKSVIEVATGRMGDQDLHRLVKFIELRQYAIDEKNHSIDPEKFRAEMRDSVKAIIVGQGLITTNDLQQFVKQAGPMAKNISADQLFADYLAAVEDMGGSRTGTALTAAARQILGGIMTPDVAERWQAAGMLGPINQGWHRNTKGQIKIDDASEAITGYQIMAKEGFGAWMNKVMGPALERQGYKTTEEKNKALYQYGSTETARRLMSLFNSPAQIHLVADRYKKAMGSDAYDKLFDGGDLQTGVKGIHEAMTTLKTALGDAAYVSPYLQSLAKGIASLANAAKDHPKLAFWASVGGYVGGKGIEVAGMGGLAFAGYRLITAAGALEAAALTMKGGGLAGAATGAGAAAAGGMIAPIAAAAAVAAVPIALAIGTAGKHLPEEQVKARMEMVDLKKKIEQLDGLIAGGMASPNTQAKRDAAQARFDELKRSLEQAGAEAGKGAAQNLKLGFDLNGFTATGGSAAKNITGGFLSAPFDAVGRAAGAQVAAGLAAALGGASGGVSKMSFGKSASLSGFKAPPKAGHTIEIHNIAHLDGEVVHRSVERRMIAAAEHPTGSPHFNAEAMFPPPDMQYAAA